MEFGAPPATAAWVHQEARTGFEVAYFVPVDDGLRIDGCTTAVEDGQSWIVSYQLVVDPAWRTRSARVVSRTEAGEERSILLEADGSGQWTLDGEPLPHLDGCLDVDLESSALTNAFPVHRLGLDVSDASDAPAAYVRALDLAVERLEQHYTRVDDDGPRQRFDYHSPVFDFRCLLVYDEHGLVLTYPGIARRSL